MKEKLKNLRSEKLNFKKAYSSEDDDLLSSFYLPLLSESKNYYRLTGFFTSTALSLAARGISDIVKSEGKIKILTGHITEGDYFTAEKYFNNKALFIKEICEQIDDFDNMEDVFAKESLKAFAWLLSKC